MFGSVSSSNNQNSGVLPVNSLKYQGNAEEFITYYLNDFRKDSKGEIISICDIVYESYQVMNERYVSLSDADRQIVNVHPDYEEGYTILDSIKELANRFSKTQPGKDKEERHTLNQSTTISIIVIVAIFGMSSICIFFVLKNSNIIE